MAQFYTGWKLSDDYLRINVDFQIVAPTEKKNYPLVIMLSRTSKNVKKQLRKRLGTDLKAIYNLTLDINWRHAKETFEFLDYPDTEEFEDDFPTNLKDHMDNVEYFSWTDLLPIQYKVIYKLETMISPDPLLGIPKIIFIDRSNVIQDFHRFLSETSIADMMQIPLFNQEQMKDIQFLAQNEEGVGIGMQRSLFQSYFKQISQCDHLFEKENMSSLLLPRRHWNDTYKSDYVAFGKMLCLAKYYDVSPHMFHPLVLVGFATDFFVYRGIEIMPRMSAITDIDVELAGFSLPSTPEEWRHHVNFTKWTQVYHLDHIAVEEEWTQTSESAYSRFRMQAERYMAFKFRQRSIAHIVVGTKSLIPWLTRSYMMGESDSDLTDPVEPYAEIKSAFVAVDGDRPMTSVSITDFLSNCELDSEEHKILFYCAVTLFCKDNKDGIMDLIEFIAATISRGPFRIKFSGTSQQGSNEKFLPYASTCTQTLYIYDDTSPEELAADLQTALSESDDGMHLL